MNNIKGFHNNKGPCFFLFTCESDMMYAAWHHNALLLQLVPIQSNIHAHHIEIYDSNDKYTIINSFLNQIRKLEWLPLREWLTFSNMHKFCIVHYDVERHQLTRYEHAMVLSIHQHKFYTVLNELQICLFRKKYNDVVEEINAQPNSLYVQNLAIH